MENEHRCPSCGASEETLVDVGRDKNFKPAYAVDAQRCFYCGWDNRVVTVTEGQATLNLTAKDG